MWENIDIGVSADGGFLDENISPIEGNKININRGERLDSITPIMIGHILNSEKNGIRKLSVYGLPLDIITFIGIVRHIEQSTTKVTFEIEDETGAITGIKWLEIDEESAVSSIKGNTYVRVHGLVQDNNDRQRILILTIVPIEDLNELINHLLEVTYIILKAKEMLKTKVEVREEDAYSDLSQNHLTIYKIILAENNSDCGIERSMVKERAPPYLKSLTDKLLEFLIDSGHIYTTLTNDHFKTT